MRKLLLVATLLVVGCDPPTSPECRGQVEPATDSVQVNTNQTVTPSPKINFDCEV